MDLWNYYSGLKLVAVCRGLEPEAGEGLRVEMLLGFEVLYFNVFGSRSP